MADVFTAAKRSEIMARIGPRDTKPELRVRKLAHAMGYRFRLHRRDLPGCPDLVFPKHHKIIFVHGCFWHQHDCPRGSQPNTNVAFWKQKLQKNVERDRVAISQLASAGWEVLIIWECEVRDFRSVAKKLEAFLER